MALSIPCRNIASALALSGLLAAPYDLYAATHSFVEPAPATAVSTAASPVPDPYAALLDPIVHDPSLGKALGAVHLVDVTSSSEVYAFNADSPMLPASTMKIVTSAAALRVLGPAWRFDTDILHDGELDAEGVLSGNLYVRGQGDPSLVVERLWKMVLELRLRGVREVKGNVFFDGSFMDTDSGVPGWDKTEDQEEAPSYYPALGPLSLNFNTVAIWIGPGPDLGSPARLEIETSSPAVVVENEVVTSGHRTRRSIRVERRVEDRKTIFEVRGQVPAGSTARPTYRAVADATAWFEGAFATLCREADIRVKGRYTEGKTPEDAEMLVHGESPPLGVILQDLNKHSNNFMAEQVLKAMGAVAHGAPGTTGKGLRVVEEYLASLGLPAEEYRFANGSGLSRKTTLRAEHLTAVLVDMWKDRLVAPEFLASLSIGGRDGTLRSRFRDDDLKGRIRGKTGSLNGVQCLAGYVEAPDGAVYAFAFLVNDVSGPLSRVRRVQDRFAGAVLGASPSATLADVEEDEGTDE
ncbi:MAG: D-alanyl-D-alanine carboxypeptidase/D-alanyl-D-alanine-endopeptidase [Deltaproteobacteria bacterium]|nr:D-alanyl-D-alanine carboxypeptidase/D-alanyl-D-alanine-endopeptidase [Deltaproteobacteria bacterium]